MTTTDTAREPGTSSAPAPERLPERTRIAIIGSGFAGLGMAIRLRRSGVEDFVVLERASELGGTWRDNPYPGAACDVPSHLYSFSFAPNPRWSRSFSPQREIQDYLVRCAEQYGIRRFIHFDTPLASARWDAAAEVWRISTPRGELAAEILVTGSGALSDSATPDLPGLADFTGTTFHSAQWRHDHDLRGELVAVIGTGASAIQFVPQIQPDVRTLTLFQRTPPWIVPRMDRPLSRIEQTLFRRLPILQRVARTGIYWGRESYVLGYVVNQKLLEGAEKIARRHLHHQIHDEALRAKLSPDYTMGCKRVLISNDYYPALGKPNVEVETAGIARICDRSIRTTDGREHPVDTIIFGTGFQVADLPIGHQIQGTEGDTLAQVWRGSPHAYLGTSVHGFPNLFLLVGPNTGLGHTSQVFMIEAQIGYTLDAILTMARNGIRTVEIEERHQRRYTEAVHKRMRRTVWTTGCDSWYLDASGRNTTLWPGATFRFRSITKRFPLDRYRTTQTTQRSAAEPGPRVPSVAGPRRES